MSEQEKTPDVRVNHKLVSQMIEALDWGIELTLAYGAKLTPPLRLPVQQILPELAIASMATLFAHLSDEERQPPGVRSFTVKEEFELLKFLRRLSLLASLKREAIDIAGKKSALNVVKHYAEGDIAKAAGRQQREWKKLIEEVTAAMENTAPGIYEHSSVLITVHDDRVIATPDLTDEPDSRGSH
jgi:hypothetical protein